MRNKKDNIAVSCIIDGLPISLQGSAKSGNYKNPEELFQGFLSKLESENIGKEKIENQVFKPNEVCHICKKSGHIWLEDAGFAPMTVSYQHSTVSYAHRLPIPIINDRLMLFYPNKKRCVNCGKNGHLKEECWFLKPATVKTLNRQVQNDI